MITYTINFLFKNGRDLTLTVSDEKRLEIFKTHEGWVNHGHKKVVKVGIAHPDIFYSIDVSEVVVVSLKTHQHVN